MKRKTAKNELKTVNTARILRVFGRWVSCRVVFLLHRWRIIRRCVALPLSSMQDRVTSRLTNLVWLTVWGSLAIWSAVILPLNLLFVAHWFSW